MYTLASPRKRRGERKRGQPTTFLLHKSGRKGGEGDSLGGGAAALRTCNEKGEERRKRKFSHRLASEEGGKKRGRGGIALIPDSGKGISKTVALQTKEKKGDTA